MGIHSPSRPASPSTAARGVVGGVPVDVAGDGNRGLPEQIGDRLDMHTGLEPVDGRTVPQRVHTDALDAGCAGS